MKLLRFNLKNENRTMARLGVLLRGDSVVDLRAATARYLSEVEGDSQAAQIAALRIPPDMIGYLQIGAPSRRLVDATLDWLKDLADADSATDLRRHARQVAVRSLGQSPNHARDNATNIVHRRQFLSTPHQADRPDADSDCPWQ